MANTLAVEYDATRLDATTITKLIREAGLDATEIQPHDAPQTEPQPALVP
jgi:hypothetical protein